METTKQQKTETVYSKDGRFHYISDRKVERKAGTENYRNCPITPKIMQWAQATLGQDLINGRQVVFKLLQDAKYPGTIEDLGRDAPEAVADTAPVTNTAEAYIKAINAEYDKRKAKGQSVGTFEDLYGYITKIGNIDIQNKVLYAFCKPETYAQHEFKQVQPVVASEPEKMF